MALPSSTFRGAILNGGGRGHGVGMHSTKRYPRKYSTGVARTVLAGT